MSGNFEVCPIGTLQRLATAEAECDALAEANEAFGKRQVWWDNKMLALEAQRNALLADAERYRWLRSARDENFWHCHEKDGYGGQILMYGVDLDAAIDAAMKGGGNG